MEYGRFADVYDALMESANYDRWARYLESFLREAYPDTDAERLDILDCACGTGSLSVRLAIEGYRVTGLDISGDMLRVAQEKARASGLHIAFIRQDMREIALHRPVDAIVCACDGVNYLLSEAELAAFFTTAYKALRPGGCFLFDVSTLYKLEHVLGNATYGEDTRDCTYLWKNCYDPESRLCEMRLNFFVPDGQRRYERFDERHVQRAHTDAEIRSALSKAGFTNIEAFDAFTRNVPHPASERVQWAARRDNEYD